MEPLNVRVEPFCISTRRLRTTERRPRPTREGLCERASKDREEGFNEDRSLLGDANSESLRALIGSTEITEAARAFCSPSCGRFPMSDGGAAELMECVDEVSCGRGGSSWSRELRESEKGVSGGLKACCSLLRLGKGELAGAG